MPIVYPEGCSLEDLVRKVEEWGDKHNLHDPVMQFAKVNEEVGEIAHELTRNNMRSPEAKDAIGDALVTLIIFAHQNKYNVKECLRAAYEEIKDRDGETVNGTFVKKVKK